MIHPITRFKEIEKPCITQIDRLILYSDYYIFNFLV